MAHLTKSIVFGGYWVELTIREVGDLVDLEVTLRSQELAAAVEVHLNTNSEDYTLELPPSHYDRHPLPVMSFTPRFDASLEEDEAADEGEEEEEEEAAGEDEVMESTEPSAKRQKTED
jgi:hypothetical protein